MGIAGRRRRTDHFRHRTASSGQPPGSRVASEMGVTTSGPTSAEALDMLSTGIVLADRTGQMVRRNAAADALVDSWDDGVVGRRVLERLSDAVRPGASATIEQVRTPGVQPRVYEVTVRPVGTGSPIGQITNGAVALFEDITERVRVEAVRRDFVANVSHELKTPVGAISLLAEALEGERDPEVVERLTGRIGNEARRVSGLVEDLLDLRSIEEGDVGGATTVDLVEVAAEVLERVEPLAQRRGVSLKAELPASAEVIGIHTQLLSLLRNLVENGVKYSDTGGSVQLNIAKNGNEIVVRVTDRGMGIPQRDHDRVFERFYRVDRARTRDTGGSGLGLSIVRNVVQGHRGNVELTSQEGEGTTVTVRLPIGLVPPEADH